MPDLFQTNVASTVQSLLATASSHASASTSAASAAWRRHHAASLSSLFSSLDRNQDGVISRDEFNTAPASSWAAMHTIAMSLPTVDEAFQHIGQGIFLAPYQRLTTGGAPWYTWIAAWIYYLVLLQLVLAGVEHARYWLGARCLPKRKAWPSAKEKQPYLSGTKRPRHVPNAEALCWYDTPQTTLYIRLKTAFMLLSGLCLLRIIQGCVVFVLAVAAINMANVLPLRSWRALWLGAARWLTYLLLASLGYYKVPVTGAFAGPEEVRLLMGNHVCLIEVIVMFAEAFPSFVSRAENLSIPLFTGIVHAVDAILVDRAVASSRGGALEEIRKRVCDDEGSSTGTQVMIFPEGTCNNSNTLFRFNKGPFSLGKPVQMACFQYPYRSYNPAYIGRALGGNELGDVILHCTMQFVNRIEVRILPVHHPTREEIESEPKGQLYANNMQRRMAIELGNSTSNATNKDYDLALKRFNEARKEETRRRRIKQMGRLSGLRRKKKAEEGSAEGDAAANDGAVYSTETMSALGDGTNEAATESGNTVWWPWTAWDSVLRRVQAMIADEAQRTKKTEEKRD